ncbi:putative GTP-binding protein 6 [Patella vulgata]|uniref:putative GTP-binding protein 6 n=1 Tax=Patella vulgata TaxID=6465 RepID=UPI0021807572|nr:putative GTP-binding protein 6 [Patella vulgata]
MTKENSFCKKTRNSLYIWFRYTIVLQIFKDHARTKESKLQIALAEIPFLRNRLNQFQDGQHDQQVGGAQLAGGAGQTYLHSRRLILQEREMKLRKALSKLENQRSLLRKERLKRKIPSIAVVGYTNAGKTTLIKALTGDSKLEPKDYLFATLDVTAHAGKLPNNMTALFMDTVGFISDIPINLIDAFSATLEDAVIADVIIHVRDISHPDTENQKQNVLQTLSTMLPADKLPNIIEVCNKIDLWSSDISMEETSSIFISATSGRGLLQLRHEIQHRLIQATGQLKKKFKIPNGGPHLSWLYKEATVCGIEPHEDVEYLIVDTVISVSAYSKFKSYFSNSKYKDS